MNRDIEDFPERFLAWLLQRDNSPEASLPSSSFVTPTDAPDSLLYDDNIEDWEIDEFDQLESEALNAATISSFSYEPTASPPSSPAGDIPAVEERFQALLKRRLQVELQNNPPLFPWETEIADYEPDVPEAELVPPNQLWTAQLQQLQLPVPIPLTILSQLLDRCQAVVQSSRADTAKLVRAVEALFPGHAQALSKFAGVIVTSTALRNVERVDFSQTANPFPSSYEAATLTEQMVLLLIAARQIIGALTLTLSPTQPVVERQWLTTVGLLRLQAEYQVETRLFASLRVQGQLPCGGSLKLQVGQAQAIAQRPDPGQVSVELFDLALDRIYPLEVLFPELERQPLIFGICPKT